MKKVTETLHKNPCTFVTLSRCILLIMRNISDTSCRNNQNTRLVFTNFFWKSCHLWDNVEKCGRPRQATDNNTVLHTRHASCTPVTKGHKVTVFNTYCFSTATMVTRTSFNVT